jgi:hypothetical protein
MAPHIGASVARPLVTIVKYNSIARGFAEEAPLCQAGPYCFYRAKNFEIRMQEVFKKLKIKKEIISVLFCATSTDLFVLHFFNIPMFVSPYVAHFFIGFGKVLLWNVFLL